MRTDRATIVGYRHGDFVWHLRCVLPDGPIAEAGEPVAPADVAGERCRYCRKPMFIEP